MPNIVTNLIAFSSGDDTKEAFRRMLEAVRKDGEPLGSITFDRLIPMPEYVRVSMETGGGGGESPLWDRWSCENWGSKWDAIDYCPLEPEQGDDTMTFSTAWTPVEPVVTALSRMFPDQTITYRWAENENPGMNVGELSMRNGEKLSEWIPDDFSPEAFALSADILETDLSDYGLCPSETGSACEEQECLQSQPRTERRNRQQIPAR